MKVARMSALRTGRLYPQKIFLVLISVRGWVNSKGHSAAGRIMSIKNLMKPSGIEPATFWLVALCHRAPHFCFIYFTQYLIHGIDMCKYISSIPEICWNILMFNAEFERAGNLWTVTYICVLEAYLTIVPI